MKISRDAFLAMAKLCEFGERYTKASTVFRDRMHDILYSSASEAADISRQLGTK